MKLSHETRIRLAEASRKFADDAHEPVLQISKKQNRELSYANSVGASRRKESELLKLSWWSKFLTVHRIELAEGSARLRQS
jgi:hypothetical protein